MSRLFIWSCMTAGFCIRGVETQNWRPVLLASFYAGLALAMHRVLGPNTKDVRQEPSP